MRKAFLILLILGLPFVSERLTAEPEKPIIQFTAIKIQGLGPEEGRMIESLIFSYLTAIGNVMLDIQSTITESLDNGLLLPSRGGHIPDFTLSGSVTLEQDNRILKLEIRKPATNEVITFTSIHKTTSELLLKARGLIEAAFNGPAETAQDREKLAEPLSEAAITGIWKGDRGIEMIRLQKGGKGIAIFSSGAQMNLRYLITGNSLQVVQDSPNTERYYHPTPYTVAKELAAKAEPMRWELLLYDQGSTLKGIKVTTGVRYEGNTILELFPGSVREAEWIRTSH